ncbi:hypothetical protein BSL78_28471 [Apostichopus japonicus]|uniref:Protein MEMO1 n=1 Tax=Stichopus japonicus TaxID=307972 RepID=A0A2G8JG60_STIJA|nr:hypothetical protein BSL78_28471 [Apostichopus japonicus]
MTATVITYKVLTGTTLGSELDGWLAAANTEHRPARAIIAPHAGYSYCGACGGHAYKQVDPLTFNAELLSCGDFVEMEHKVDEEEHSIEMHLPYIARVMQRKRGSFTIIPVLVGALKPDKEAKYGRIFSKYLEDPTNLFVVSSDFCHWGRRFSYQYYDKSFSKIYESIEQLDKQGMALIEKLDPQSFHAYLKKYENTICGRHPISVLLHAVETIRSGQKNGLNLEMKFLKYAQSNQVKSMQDSSVSYGAASLVFS